LLVGMTMSGVIQIASLTLQNSLVQNFKVCRFAGLKI